MLAHLRKRGFAWESDLGHGWPNGIEAPGCDSGSEAKTTLLADKNGTAVLEATQSHPKGEAPGRRE